MKKIYYNPETGYCGINELKRKTNLPIKDIKEFLDSQDVYTRFKPANRKFKRRRVYVPESNNQFDADLLFIRKYSKYNDQINYLLVVIDAFTKYAWVYPIKRKTASEVVEAFQKVFKEQIPKFILTDEGTEFTAKITQKLFKDNNIHWFTTGNKEIKSAIAERFNRTIQGKIMKYMHDKKTKRYIDVLPKLVKNYNTSYNRSIKLKPIDARKKENEPLVYKNLYKEKVFKKPKFKVGDRVRLSKYRETFTRGYDPTHTEEIFIVSEILKSDYPITYRVKDLQGNEIKGSIYEAEMTKYNKKDDVYKIEKIIRKKGNKYFVKWLGYPDEFNSWVDKKDLV